MQVLATTIDRFLETSSWIRRMFEAGIEMKKRYGPENVFDFSLGNPDLPPPAKVAEALHELADSLQRPLALGYMPNGGYPEVRERLAGRLAAEQKCPDLGSEHVILTCGAAGAINTLLRAVTQPGEEILCPAPYFVEYGFYADNVGCRLQTAPVRPDTFALDPDALEAAIGPATRAVIINSPNNPTGVVYDAAQLRELAALLEHHSRIHGQPIFLISDEPYRFLTYDEVSVPPILPLYPYSVVVGSFSKNLSLAGERIGYLAANPAMPDVQRLMAGVTMTNRILGFVNAPAIGQRIMAAALEQSVDVGLYHERRDAMADNLERAGIEFVRPQGAFYFFPKAPGAIDDKAFVDLLMEERILAVPGTGFGYPGCFRLTFCIDKTVIERAAEGFQRAADKARSRA